MDQDNIIYVWGSLEDHGHKLKKNLTECSRIYNQKRSKVQKDHTLVEKIITEISNRCKIFMAKQT
jgi:hypothetical protein